MVPRGFRRTFLFLEMCRRKCADVVRGEGLGVQGHDVCSLLSSGWADIQTNELNCFNREKERKIVACGNNW